MKKSIARITSAIVLMLVMIFAMSVLTYANQFNPSEQHVILEAIDASQYQDAIDNGEEVYIELPGNIGTMTLAQDLNLRQSRFYRVFSVSLTDRWRFFAEDRPWFPGRLQVTNGQLNPGSINIFFHTRGYSVPINNIGKGVTAYFEFQGDSWWQLDASTSSGIHRNYSIQVTDLPL